MAIQEGGTFSPTNNIVSPGVFTRENDLSGLAQGVSNIGGAVIAPFADGPAFYPATVTNAYDLDVFGASDGTFYGPYTAMEYFKQQGLVTVVRVGGLTGYWQKNPLIVYAEPGTWEREDDVAELYDTSFAYLDADNYTSNIKYVHASEPVMINCTESTGSLSLEEPTANYDYTSGSYVSGELITDSNIITDFLNEISLYVTNDEPDIDNKKYSAEQYNQVSRILAAAYKNNTTDETYPTASFAPNFVISLTSKEIFKAFVNSPTSNEDIIDGNVAVHDGTDTEDAMKGYDIAWFDTPNFNLPSRYEGNENYIYGTVRIENTIQQSKYKICDFDLIDTTDLDQLNEDQLNQLKEDVNKIIRNANIVISTDGKPEVLFKFINIKPDTHDPADPSNWYIPVNKNLLFCSYSYSTDQSEQTCVTNVEVSYDKSYIEYINCGVNAAFGMEATTAPAMCSYDGNDYEPDIKLRGGKVYAGKQLNIGNIHVGKLVREPVGTVAANPDTFGSGSCGFFYMSSSVQGTICTEEEAVSSAIAETQEEKSLFSTDVLYKNVGSGSFCEFDTTSEISLIPNQDYFTTSGEVKVLNFQMRVNRKPNCACELNFSGILYGEFGALNGKFNPDHDYLILNQCEPRELTTRKPMILSVLANTLNGSLQWNSDKYEVYGFKDSILTQNASSAHPYNETNNINPTENTYTLELKYNYENEDGEPISGTYGFYEFSLNESSNNYIKDVFGLIPRVGDPEKQVYGQKIAAAYNYILFEDSINKFLAEKTLPVNQISSQGWRLAVTTPDAGFSIGEALKFTDAYSTALDSGDSEFAITNAYTPWICSQKIAPFRGSIVESNKAIKHRLFKVHTLSDGTLSNQKYKIEISNIKLAGTVSGSDWGTFSLSVRKFSDTDKRPKILETFHNLTLDPDSSNFIARRIGDYYAYITFAGKILEFGTYKNLSKYIRIEMTDTPYPTSVVPYGFEAYSSPVGGSLSEYLPPVKYSKASIYSMAVGKYPSGTVFSYPLDGSDELATLYPVTAFGSSVINDTKQYFKPLPFYDGGDQNGSNIDFDLEDKIYGETGVSEFYANINEGSVKNLLYPELSGSVPAVFDPINEPTYVKMRKFIVGFQGGFDGQWPAIPINLGSDITPGNTQGLDCTNINSPGSIAYRQCIAAIGNEDEFDVNLIVTPGIFYQHHPYVCNLVIDTCERRADCFYIMDNIVFPKSNSSIGMISSAINTVSTLDTNYVATYYPWVKILDTNTNKIVSVPPSVVMPSIYAQSDKSAAEWYAPAGLNRGGIPQAVQVLDRLTHSERDELYENRINPIAAFPGQGIVVWGQKTLQINQSALDRVNVRRLLIKVKKFIASASRYLVFEQNVAATRHKFLAIAEPYLESVQQRNGLYSFVVKMDEKNNTEDLVDRNILYGQIWLQPARSAEFLIIDFNIMPSGAVFSA